MSWSTRRSGSSHSRDSYYRGFAPYVPVAERRAEAAKAAAKAAKSGSSWSAVTITGRKIASTFWGAAWCEHLESYSDYANRLPRGRTYVRNGSVVDLQIAPGVISARVQGSSLYTEKIMIKPLAPARWQAIKTACAGKVTSLVGLLQGKLPEAVLRVITDRATGLFPAPNEITLNCSCPDSASLCKHLAAVLYGVGARLDEKPELLFLLRGVDHQDLVAEVLDAASRGAPGAEGTIPGAGLTDGDLADVFGIDIGDAAPAAVPLAPTAPALPMVSAVKAKPIKPKPVRKTVGKAAMTKVAPKPAASAKTVVVPPPTKAPRGVQRKGLKKTTLAEPAAPVRSKASADLDAVRAKLAEISAKTGLLPKKTLGAKKEAKRTTKPRAKS